MSEPQPNYYKILGLPPTATPEEIKKRYRELARRYHPDINSSPEAAHKIKEINQANHILGDPDRRALYDAERLLKKPATPKSEPPRSHTPPRDSAPSGFGYDGFGRKAQSPSDRQPHPDSPKARSSTFGTVERLIAE